MTWPAGRPRGTDLQQGIYIERGIPPPPAWRAVFVDIVDGASAAEVYGALVSVSSMLTSMQGGSWPHIPAGAPRNAFGYLIGYGSSLFERTRRSPVTNLARPAYLVPLRRDGDATPSLTWAPGAAEQKPSGEADIIIQLTGVARHAVDQAAVEISHIVEDRGLPLMLTGTFDGFLRDDGRSWLGFHDGVNNVEPSQRLLGVEAGGDPEWMRGGTYLAFLRMQIDLESWRRIPQSEQELIVGRHKTTGWPLIATRVVEGVVSGVPISDEPLSAETDDLVRNSYFNPPRPDDGLLSASHVHRANATGASAATASAHRIFRQGYEYLENIDTDGARLGLNFISFQSDLLHLQQVLSLRGWLGDANFGGDPTRRSSPLALAQLQAGGFYAVPPWSIPFPGASLFSDADGLTSATTR